MPDSIKTIKKKNSVRVLFIGDIVGKLGRRTVLEVVPDLKKREKIDLVIANIENLAHGKGITKKSFEEISKSGIGVFTGGNHIFDKKEGIPLLEDKTLHILRPANYPDGAPGFGTFTVMARDVPITIINLMGRIFMKEDCDDPFRAFDRLVKDIPRENVVIVDFHAEATSEKRAFAFYVAGRASLVVGTHTHVPTADAGIITKHKLGYVTDVGMTGARDSVLGVRKDEVLAQFLTQLPVKHTMVDAGAAVFNSISADIRARETTAIHR
ncbi:MAG: TIGR00282 family metallophosphoesterase, partial [Patescibacteria group bacterium]